MWETRSEDLLVAVARYDTGAPIGPVTAVYLDEDSGRPSWVSVLDRRLLPLCRAVLSADGRLVVALPPPSVEEAPALPPGTDAVRRGFEDALYAHYAGVLSPVAGPVPPVRPVAEGRVTSRRAVVCRAPVRVP